MDKSHPSFREVAAKTIATHSVTYFVAGLLAYTLLGYEETFREPEMACWMRSTNEPLVMAGPLFQPVRGFLFALAFYPLRDRLFRAKDGWLITWLVLVICGILSTFGPAPGSLEGMVYTVIPVMKQTVGWLEVVPQALALSVLLFYWIRHPEKKWLTWTMAAAFAVVMLLPALGLVAGK